MVRRSRVHNHLLLRHLVLAHPSLRADPLRPLRSGRSTSFNAHVPTLQRMSSFHTVGVSFRTSVGPNHWGKVWPSPSPSSGHMGKEDPLPSRSGTPRDKNSDEAEANSLCGRLSPRSRAEGQLDVVDERLHGSLGKLELLGDRPGGRSGRKEPEDLDAPGIQYRFDGRTRVLVLDPKTGGCGPDTR